MTDITTDSGPILAADGTPLKTSLARALRRQKIRALMLIAPLLIFVLVAFVAPIVDMLFRSVENQIVSDTLPATTKALKSWDQSAGQPPGEDVFAAVYSDISIASEYKTHTRVGSRLNYETTGVASLFRKSGRGAKKFETHIYAEQFAALNPAWSDPATWSTLFASSAANLLPKTADTYARWRGMITERKKKDPDHEQPGPYVYTTLHQELVSLDASTFDQLDPEQAGLLSAAANQVGNFETFSLKDAFLKVDKNWDSMKVWRTMRTYSPRYTDGYFLNAVDLKKGDDGIEAREEEQRIYIKLFKRTMFMSMTITVMCILLGYPIAWLLANLPLRTANLLMILVLLPFWTSLLVRTSAWKVLLQQQGVINDMLVAVGIIGDGSRLVMINNQFGTIVAMTHILLPFMVLPLFSVMRTIPQTFVRAAKSLGATDWTAFWRVYFPQSVPGIGAGSILVFILSIGYYITPELVGGTTGVFISNRIAYHISSSLNWGLAAALGTILLAAVLLLYWAYDKIVGIDNVKLG